ncbi:MAG: methyltransferase domain-containing protein [Actinobacteria bacterium]|nr:methyltransferase domain-containing protein [Actinomycetota bacterium]
MTRPAYARLLATEWVPSLPELEARLAGMPPARVADIGCGVGRAATALAQRYPLIRVDGFDLDETSIDLARKHAAERGVADRVHFEARDASDASLVGEYELITIFEAVHDMSRPVEVLAAARRLLASGGWLIVADEKTGDSFADPGPFDGFLYGVSVLWCLPQSLAEKPSEAIGTAIRASKMESLARRAGFSKDRNCTDRVRLLALLPADPVNQQLKFQIRSGYSSADPNRGLVSVRGDLHERRP